MMMMMILRNITLIFQAAKPGGSVLKAPMKLSDEISIIPTKKDQVEYCHRII